MSFFVLFFQFCFVLFCFFTSSVVIAVEYTGPGTTSMKCEVGVDKTVYRDKGKKNKDYSLKLAVSPPPFIQDAGQMDALVSRQHLLWRQTVLVSSTNTAEK